MRVVCSVLSFGVVGLVAVGFWVAGQQVPVGIGDLTMGPILGGLLFGAGAIVLIEELRDGMNVR